MLLNVSKVDVWAASLEDRSGGLATRLEGLAKAGANLSFIICRPDGAKPGQSVVFVTPLNGEAQWRAAEMSGFHRTDTMHTLRLDGPDQPGLGYLVTRALSQSGINLRGMSVATLGGQFAMYISFYDPKDADRAFQRLQAPI